MFVQARVDGQVTVSVWARVAYREEYIMMIAVSLNTCLCVLCVIATIRQWMLEYNIYCDVDQDNICYFIVVLSEYRR